MSQKIRSKRYTRAEEAEILSAIRDGRAAQKLLDQSKKISNTEEEKLQKKTEKGKQVLAELVANYIPRCVAIINKYHSSYIQHYPDERDDLISEGILGINQAVELFGSTNSSKKLSGYIDYWIKKMILRYVVRNYHYLSITPTMLNKISDVEKVVSNYKKRYDKTPSYEEVAWHLEMSCREALSLTMLMQNPVELDSNEDLNSYNKTNFCAYQKHEHSLVFDQDFDAFEKIDSQQILWDLIDSTLDDQEKRILLLQFDSEEEPVYFPQIAMQLDIPVSQVRQLYNSSLEKISNTIHTNPYLMKKFWDYYRSLK